MIYASNLSKLYSHQQGDITVFSHLSFSASQGESITITGESGRGKTTLLYLLSGLDQATTGDVFIDNHCITNMDETEKADFRAKFLGFVFQHHFLLKDLSAFENALLPLRIINKLNTQTITEVQELFDYFGLKDRMNHFPEELSGGEKQRIAVIRALSHKPLIVFADEPTGSLDQDNAYKLEELLFHKTKEQKMTLILSTHNKTLAQRCNKIYTIDELEQK